MTDKLTIFFILFTADIVRFARAEDPHNICLSEPLAPIMTFPTRNVVNSPSFCREKLLRWVGQKNYEFNNRV